MKFTTKLDNLWIEFENINEIIGSEDTLSLWLYTDVQNNKQILDFIDRALLGDLDDNLFWGDGYKAYVDRDYTEIHFNFEDEDSSVKPCKLPTKLLREIVEVWLEEYEKFRNSKK